jgi:hypothetical protein
MAKDCSFGKENRIMIYEIKDNINRIEKKVDIGFSNIDTRITELFNHQSSKLPPWIVVLGSLGGALLGGLAIFALTH